MAWSANKLQVKWPVALFPLTPCGTESEGLSRALEATRLPQRAEGPSEVGEGRAGLKTLRGALFRGRPQEPPSSEGEAVSLEQERVRANEVMRAKAVLIAKERVDGARMREKGAE